MQRNKLPKFLFLTLLTGFLTSGISAKGEELRSNPFELEDRVWTASPDKLQDLEGLVTKLIQHQPSSAFGHYLLAQLYLRQFKEEPTHLKLLKQASELGQQAIELSPKEDYGYLIAAQVLDLMGYPENAFDILNFGKDELRSASWRSSFVSGLLQDTNTWGKRSIADFERSLKYSDTHANIVVPQLVKVLQRSYAGDKLVSELLEWRSRYNHLDFDLSLAAAYEQNANFAAAHQTYREIQKKAPTCHKAFIEDAIILHSQLNQSAQAESMLTKLIANENVLEKHQISLVKSQLGRIMLEKGDFAQSRRLFREAISKGSNSMEWLTFAHKSYEKQHRLKDFSELLLELSIKIPGSSYLYALRGEVLSENLALHDSALEAFESAILLDPERTEFHNGLGLTYYRMARYDEALTSFLKATHIDPQDATSRYNQACVLSILGRSIEALGSLREAIGIDPRLQQTARSDKDFENLREMQGFQFLTNPRSSASIRQP